MPRKPAKHPAKPKRGKKLEVEEPGVLYGRYSSHNQKDISVEQQFEKGYELAAEYGIRIIDTYADRAVSGRTDKRRDFQRMMTDAAKGKFRYVIAWKSNRMGRNMLEALINEARLQDLGVRVLYVEEDFDDTAAGRFAARSMMNVNQFYSENMAEDIKRGLYDNAANCMVANGHLPYGYKADETLHYAIDEPKAAVIREIFTRVSCGEAFVDIMASLNARGIKTSYGRPWGRSSFQKILSNERYRGIYIYGDVRKEGGIPRIISDELYFKVQEVITTKKNPQGRHRVNGDYLLTGKLFCGHCKSPMTGISGTSRSGNLHYYYVCQKRRTEKTCEKKNLRRDDIELQVAKAIKRRTLDDDTINWIADSVVEYSQHQESASGIGLLEDQLKDTQRSIKNLMAAIEQGIITPTTKARLMELEKEQSDIDRKITMAKADVIPVNRDQLVGWLKKLQAGDVHDKKYQAELFDTFLIAVYVYDNPDGQDYMKVVFNYAGSKNTVEIPLDPSVIDNVENIETGAVRLSSAQVHQKYQLPFWVIGIFLCTEDGVEVYPRQGKSIFPHQKNRLALQGGFSMKSVLRTGEILPCRMQYAPRVKSLRRWVDGFPFTRAKQGFHLPATAGDFTVRMHDLIKGVHAMAENKLTDLSMDFAVQTLQLCETIHSHSALVNQLERSSTSIGANIREASYAHGKADFIAKLQIALKECYETEYWLELFQRAGIADLDSIDPLRRASGTIRRMLIASVNTAKKNRT